MEFFIRFSGIFDSLIIIQGLLAVVEKNQLIIVSFPKERTYFVERSSGYIRRPNPFQTSPISILFFP